MKNVNSRAKCMHKSNKFYYYNFYEKYGAYVASFITYFLYNALFTEKPLTPLACW